MKNNISIPKDGLAGLKENLSSDAISGFIVFLLALPLSLGIAKASDFPPLMGLITAIVGGLVVSLIMGSKLTIKGPAAGLIVIVAGAVADFGGGDAGWHLALGAMLVAAICQILFGIFKFGKLADFFPLSAIHGMLAAIGIIIIAKQIPVMLMVDPKLMAGKGPLSIIASLPQIIANFDPRGTLIGLVSLGIMLGWPYLKKFSIGKLPAPLIVLIFAIPAQLFMSFTTTAPAYSLVKIGNLIENIHVNVSFEGLAHPGIFIKYVIMFALVGTLESLLTVKAIDLMDPFKRKADNNKDLIAVGIGNSITAILGGLPMISEVARSSANVNNGGKTRWANFFHGFFILVFVLLASKYIEMIPNAALAAMLISVGIKLAHPKEFIHTFHIGKEQLAIFLVTIIVTLAEDLLLGIFAGMLLKIIIHLINGVPISSLFKAPVIISFEGNNYLVEIDKAAIFTNYIGIKSRLESIPYGFNVTIDLKNTKLTDHSVMENLVHFKNDYEAEDPDGKVSIVGLESHKPFSAHEFSAKKKK
ncbi:MAG: SulP family inorganic anion transporter [Saprospiraceae bacterium]|nr:SulP family inorganic anion transporter [Saprospiraceae bacterium]